MRKSNFVFLKIIALALLLIFTVALPAAGGPMKKSNRAKLKAQTAKVEITEKGYQPVSVKLRRGVPARVTFLRKTDATCAKEVVLSAYGVRRELPLNKEVIVSFTPKKSGEFTFSCGMNMMRGKLIVQ